MKKIFISDWIKNTRWLLDLFHVHFHEMQKHDKSLDACYKTDTEWQNEFNRYLLENRLECDVNGKKMKPGEVM